MIGFHGDGTDFRPSQRGRTAKWLERVVVSEGRRLGAVNFVFCSPERMLETNRQFLGHDYPTDVITFDYSDGDVVGGDVFIDPQTVRQNAEIFWADPRVEMRRVMVHGVLHLCGYGDRSVGERRVMRAKEDYYLKLFYATV